MTNVLLVDDDETFRRTTARILTAHAFTCVEAADATAALAALDSNADVAVVLCDIRMPVDSGIQLLRQVAADFSDVAVVIMTAVDDPQVAETAFELGAFGYMIKPFDTNELLIGLASALRRRDLEARDRAAVRALESTIQRTRTLGRVLDGFERDTGVSPEGDEEMIERPSRAVSLHDDRTGCHAKRVSRSCVVLAEGVGYTGLPLDDLRRATALHDVGKIGVPERLVLKPGPLSADERGLMQRHASIGYQLLGGSTSPLLYSVAADVALTHHEWWDGSGYPRGLRGTEIPEEARITAVADVFDALTSDLVYRPALAVDEALATMEDLRSRQFEPRLFDAFRGSIDAIDAIRLAYPDPNEGELPIRILVVDDHEIFTHSLIRLLEDNPGLKVVGTAGSVAHAVSAMSAYLPDVILMDFELPDGDGAEATERIKALMPSVQVIMLTARTDEHALVRAIAAGCSGFVKKEDSVERLREVIVAVHEGETSAPSDMERLLRRLRPTRRGIGSALTPRETEVLNLIALGRANKEIAVELGLTLNTVRNHAQNILSKLNVHSKLEAVATAVREGVIRYG